MAPDTLDTRTSDVRPPLQEAGLKGPESDSAFSSPVASQAVVELDRSCRRAGYGCAMRRACGSAAGDRSRYRKGAAGRQRDLSLVPRLRHQDDDRLRRAQGRQGRAHDARSIADGVASGGLAVALQDGF